MNAYRENLLSKDQADYIIVGITICAIIISSFLGITIFCKKMVSIIRTTDAAPIIVSDPAIEHGYQQCDPENRRNHILRSHMQDN